MSINIHYCYAIVADQFTVDYVAFKQRAMFPGAQLNLITLGYHFKTGTTV